MATTTHTEAPGGAHGAFPPFQGETFASQLLWFAVFFVLLYLLVSRIAAPRIGGILQARRSAIENDLAEAERLREESEAVLAAYEKALGEARARAQALGNETHEHLAAESEARRKALEAELAARLADAERQVEATKQAAMVNVRAIATDTAAAIVQRLIGRAPAPQAVETAVDAALKR